MLWVSTWDWAHLGDSSEYGWALWVHSTPITCSSVWGTRAYSFIWLWVPFWLRWKSNYTKRLPMSHILAQACSHGLLRTSGESGSDNSTYTPNFVCSKQITNPIKIEGMNGLFINGTSFHFTKQKKKKRNDRVEWRIWIIFAVYYSMLVKNV